MSVWFTLRVGPNPVGHFEAQRVAGATGTDPDDVNVYKGTVELNGARWSGEVSHRYGDGAFGLVRRVLEAIEADEVRERV